MCEYLIKIGEDSEHLMKDFAQKVMLSVKKLSSDNQLSGDSSFMDIPMKFENN